MANKATICFVVMGVIGALLIIISMAGFAFFPPLIESQIFKTLDVTDAESEGYKNFVSGFVQTTLIQLLLMFYLKY